MPGQPGKASQASQASQPQHQGKQASQQASRPASGTIPAGLGPARRTDHPDKLLRPPPLRNHPSWPRTSQTDPDGPAGGEAGWRWQGGAEWWGGGLRMRTSFSNYDVLLDSIFFGIYAPSAHYLQFSGSCA